MTYRQLGRSGVRVSRLCLGAMGFGAGTDEATSIEIVRHALDAGINFIDTADLDAVEELRSLAQARGCSLAELAHAWLEQQPGMTAAIAGPKTVEHLQAAIKGSELTLDEEELVLIDQIVPSGKAVSDFYNGVVYARIRDLWYPTLSKSAISNPRRIPE